MGLSNYSSIPYFNSNISLWNFAFFTLSLLFGSFSPWCESLECASLSLSMKIVLILQGPTGGSISPWSLGYVFHHLMTLFYELLLLEKELSNFMKVQFVFNVNYFWTPKDTWKVPNTTNHQGNANQNYIAPVRICIIKKTTKNKCWPKCREKGTLLHCCWDYKLLHHYGKQYATAKSLQSCPTLCDPMDGSPPGSPVPGILQARTLEWAAISFSSAWKWEVKEKSLNCVRLLVTPWTAAHQAPRSMGFSRREEGSGVPSPSPDSVLRRGTLRGTLGNEWKQLSQAEGWGKTGKRKTFQSWNFRQGK